MPASWSPVAPTPPAPPDESTPAPEQDPLPEEPGNLSTPNTTGPLTFFGKFNLSLTKTIGVAFETADCVAFDANARIQNGTIQLNWTPSFYGHPTQLYVRLSAWLPNESHIQVSPFMDPGQSWEFADLPNNTTNPKGSSYAAYMFSVHVAYTTMAYNQDVQATLNFTHQGPEELQTSSRDLQCAKSSEPQPTQSPPKPAPPPAPPQTPPPTSVGQTATSASQEALAVPPNES